MAVDRGKHVIPLLVQSDAPIGVRLYSLQFRDSSHSSRYNQELEALLDDIRKGKAVTSSKRFSNVPRVPSAYVNRSAELDPLRQKVLQRQRPVIVLRTSEGAGSVGKSVLAQALCQDPDVVARFRDGVVWVRIGPEKVDIAQRLAVVGKALSDGAENYASHGSAVNRLNVLLPSMAVLLVLDDVNEASLVEPLCCGCTRLHNGSHYSK
jgi:hypothetical protein